MAMWAGIFDLVQKVRDTSREMILSKAVGTTLFLVEHDQVDMGKKQTYIVRQPDDYLCTGHR
jgi:hypothetical protein